MSGNNNDLLQRMRADAESAAVVSLDDVRVAARAARDLALEIEDLQTRLADKTKQLQTIREQRLVDLFSRAGVKVLELDRDGNLPPYVAKLKPFYKANIAADWPDDKREEAFDWLEENGEGDMIKRTFVVELGKDSEEDAEKLRKALEAFGLDYNEKLAVPHGTLTSWLKDRTEKKLPLPELSIIGGQVGRVVEIKPVKEKQPRIVEHG